VRFIKQSVEAHYMQPPEQPAKAQNH